METLFDSPERTAVADLQAEIAAVNGNPVVTGLLYSISGLIAVLDENRQVVALNDSFLKVLGIADSSKVLGLRLGETVQCVHSDEEPFGCGTTQYCRTCGAAIAIMSGIRHDKPLERICALTVDREGILTDMAFLVRSSPVRVDEQRFLLVFLQDITLQQQRAALERTFFHDINNMLVGLIGASDMLESGCSNPDLVRIIRSSSSRLHKEVEMQRCLFQGGPFSFQPERFEVMPGQVIRELQAFYKNHPAARNKTIVFSQSGADVPVKTDMSLLLRVLCNMVTNALEATDDNGEIKVWFEHGKGQASFCVWNQRPIEPDMALRIFQRNFSTKSEAGRGIGTYSMKLFGEKILGGKVTFYTSAEKGTVFTISLPS